MTSLSVKDQTPSLNLADFFREGRALIDARLDQLLPVDSIEPIAVHSAIRWSVFAGGKRFRPLLLLAAGTWAAVLVPWLARQAALLAAEHQRRMYVALGAWAITDLVVVLAWGT